MSNSPSAQPISIDDAAEVDSALGDDESVLTETLRSSLLESVKENGRGYHRYTGRSGSQYPLPEDDQEQDRSDLQHAMFLRTFDGKLFMSPIERELHEVLDLGTGTGIWAL